MHKYSRENFAKPENSIYAQIKHVAGLPTLPFENVRGNRRLTNSLETFSKLPWIEVFNLRNL